MCFTNYLNNKKIININILVLFLFYSFDPSLRFEWLQLYILPWNMKLHLEQKVHSCTNNKSTHIDNLFFINWILYNKYHILWRMSHPSHTTNSLDVKYCCLSTSIPTWRKYGWEFWFSRYESLNILVGTCTCTIWSSNNLWQHPILLPQS